jgi:hypothetical protein
VNLPVTALHGPEDICNARENGLLGNGVTNDQPALAALVARLGAAVARDGRPRVIYCPPGEYLIADASTVWASGVSLIGAGAGATRFILANPDKRNVAVALARYSEQLDGASAKQPLVDCTFANFEVDGARVELAKYDTRAKALDLQYLLRPMFRDLHIHHAAATGLGCDHLQDGTIPGVVAEHCGRLNSGREPGGAIGNTRGPYTVRGNRISYNGRHGYYQHNPRNDPAPAREITIDGNDIWKNALDGVHFGAPTVDACITNNRIRNNGRRVPGNVSRGGPGVTYTPSGLRDAEAHWPVDAHKGKQLLAADMTVIVASNNEQELHLLPWRPAAPVAWEKHPPSERTPYLLRDDASRVRAGIALAAPVRGAWIRGNRVWDNQERCTQTHAIFTAEGVPCEDCRIEE